MTQLQTAIIEAHWAHKRAAEVAAEALQLRDDAIVNGYLGGLDVHGIEQAAQELGEPEITRILRDRGALALGQDPLPPR